DTLFSSNQCDTMITMDVQFLNNSTSELEIETCPNGVVIYGGVSIAAGSSHNFNFLNAAGCDSTLTVFALGTLVLRDTISLVSCDTLDYAGMRLPPNSMHDITLQSAQGCDSIVTVRVVPDERNDNFLGPDLAICANEFVLSGLGDETVWNGSITSKNLTVTISGAYTALHVATDGCTYEDTVVLNFSNVAIFIPNAFTPNSDDLNECFAPILGGSAQFVLNYQFRIYNLYGQRIFSTEDPEECWTGIVQEDNSQGDVYFWMLEGYNSACDLRINQSGTVTMLR
ncbi:MAG: gliding motility-associated-like protein, partial [Bacteroidia bacterium]